ncbi:MAG: ABC transporter substrate-binding protein [Rhizobiaceae bacterium]
MIRLLLILSLFLPAYQSAKAADTIGLSLPLEGRLSAVTKRMEYGAKLALQRLKDSGHDLELALVDDACDPVWAPENAQKLRESYVKIVVGPVCFRSATALAKFMSRPREGEPVVPVVAVNTRNKLLGRLREVDELSLWSLSNSPNAEAQAIVDLVLPQFQNRPYAIIDDGSVYGRALADDIRLLAEEAGSRPILSSNFRPLQTTQISLLRRMQKSGVEALIIAAAPEDVVTIANDLRTLKLDWMVATGERGQLLPYTATAQSNMAGMLIVKERDLASESAKAIIGDVGEVEIENSMLLGFALVEIGAGAIKRNLTDLAGESFDTVIGPVTFGTDGRASPAPFVVQQWRDGGFEPLVAN